MFLLGEYQICSHMYFFLFRIESSVNRCHVKSKKSPSRMDSRTTHYHYFSDLRILSCNQCSKRSNCRNFQNQFMPFYDAKLGAYLLVGKVVFSIHHSVLKNLWEHNVDVRSRFTRQLKRNIIGNVQRILAGVFSCCNAWKR